MSINDAALEQVAADIFYHLGDDAVFYPTDGDPVPCKVNVEMESHNEPDGYTMQAKGEQITVEGLRHILGKIPVARTPNREGEKFIMDDTDIVYEVQAIIESDDRFVTCGVKQVE